MLKTKESRETGGMATVTALITAIIVSSAIYVLIVKYFMIKVMHLNAENNGGYSATFGELVILNTVVLLIGYILFWLLELILGFKSLASKIILAGLCMPVVWISLFYIGFGVDWESPTTYVYLFLLCASGAFIIYIPQYYARRLQSRN
jgi:heme/copper-type cytochrome/quinol oxidase subunit 4